jgi:hypothetical protein
MLAPRAVGLTEEKLRAAANAGLTLSETARLYKVTTAAIVAWKHSRGIEFKTARGVAGLTEHEADQYRELTQRSSYSRAEALRTIGRSDLLPTSMRGREDLA